MQTADATNKSIPQNLRWFRTLSNRSKAKPDFDFCLLHHGTIYIPEACCRELQKAHRTYLLYRQYSTRRRCEIGSDGGAIDLHRYILMDTGKEKAFLEGLFKRSGYKNVFGVQTHVPSNEDLLFITLVNLARNLREKTSQAGLLYALFDCKFLIESKSDFNWNIVRENAQKTGVEVQMNFVIKFIEKISKNVLPVEIQNNMLFEKETNEYSNMVMFNRFYLEEIRTKCRQMKISNIIKNPAEWKDYIFLKPKYMALKTLKKHPKLIELFIKDLRGKNAIQ